ncbi:DUF2397 domain-containing protein [Kribbella sp. NBC_00482]|uniref:DUF2397 domain-containing protein n=1 Tax=Kribbella sp. NBC_00482 TaxID=2975968 RepID=UPI002E17A00D
MADGGDEFGPLDEATDTWALAGLPGRATVPAYLVSRYAAQYRVIVDILLAEQDNSLTGLSYDEVAAAASAHLARALTPEVADELIADWNLEQRLEQLEDWKVVTSWQEAARSGEDFLRRRDRYQLTPAGARLHSFWTDPQLLDDASDGDLTLAPRAIHDRLAAFADAVRDQRFVDAAGEYQQVTALHHAMANAARRWQRGLAHALSGGPDEAKQDLLWRTLQAYVAMWGEQVDVNSPRIAELIEDLDPELDVPVWRACVRASLADDAPDDLVVEHCERWARTWGALGSWFVGPSAQARRLRRQLRDLVAPWARNMYILMDSAGVITRRPELLRLAAAIEQAESDDDAWRIWDTAAGMFSARHLLLPAEQADDSALSWSEAPPAPVTARFRQQGPRAAVGRRAKTPDYSLGKTAARRGRLAALAARREAEAALRRRSGTALATWESLNRAELDLLLEFLGAVRRAGTGQDGVRAAVTADGRWKVQLRPTRSDDAAVLETPDGTLVLSNWIFEVAPA